MAEFQPSEEAIAKLLARFTPRELAIGYLRTRRKLRTYQDLDRARFEHTAAPDDVRRTFNRIFEGNDR